MQNSCHFYKIGQKLFCQVAAMCATPSIFAKVGITKGRSLTSYPGPKLEPLFEDANYLEDAVVIDGKMITSRGPATALPFVFALVFCQFFYKR